MSRKRNVTTGMCILTVVGVSNSGKTTVVEGLVTELTARGYTVGTVKSISCGSRCHLLQNGVCHCSGGGNHHAFTIDTAGKNSARHRAAGSQQVTTWAENETAVLYPRELTYRELVALYDFDYLILEGDYYSPAPRIVTAKAASDATERITDLTFAVSGRISNDTATLSDLPVINPLDNIDALADLVEAKVFPQLPFADDLGCNLCGMSCRALSAKMLRGEATIDNCLRKQPTLTLSVAGEAVSLTPEVSGKLTLAVQQALRSAGIAPANASIHIDATDIG
ncbi:MAG: molybdopterin-guanine dinucleotide biosynthesis protein B [Angelakisella sp.]